MKRALSILYWVAAIVIVAAVVLSFHYRAAEAFFIGTCFLPGALAAKYAFSKLPAESKADRIKGGIFASAGIMTGEILLMYLAHFVISALRAGLEDYYDWQNVPSILQNPIFLAIMTVSLALGSVWIDALLEKRFPSGPRTVTFLSDRHPVSVKAAEILYVESNDAITIVHTQDGAEYKNKTPISQWESILEDDFVRIHRSFIVNRAAITSTEKDSVHLGEIELPISRKYKSTV